MKIFQELLNYTIIFIHNFTSILIILCIHERIHFVLIIYYPLFNPFPLRLSFLINYLIFPLVHINDAIFNFINFALVIKLREFEFLFLLNSVLKFEFFFLSQTSRVIKVGSGRGWVKGQKALLVIQYEGLNTASEVQKPLAILNIFYLVNIRGVARRV